MSWQRINTDFDLGQRVRLTALAREKKIHSRAPDRLGTVRGYSKAPWGLIVVRDGTKTPVSYHVDFWEPVYERRRPRR